jgi:formylglycine-generating enzyme required for sulfatase activity
LKRHLASEPVLASPPSRIYRLRKLLQRRRGFFIAATFVLLAITAGSIASVTFLVSSRRLARETQFIADGKRLDDLIDELPGLPGIEYSTRRLAMDRWIESIESVVLRLKDPTVPISPTTEQQHERVQQLIQSRVEGPEGVLELARVWAARTPSIQQFDARWSEYSTSVEKERNGLALKPMKALYPLGRDTRSRFWQFVDLRTGLTPQRDRDGNFVVDEMMGVIFVLLPGGQYLKGSPPTEEDRKDDEFECQVSVNPFMISQYEITQAQWERIMGRNPSGFDGANRPVDSLSWNNCQEFCLTTGMRLPSEAQWEYACRAHQSGPFSGSGLIDEMGWYGENSDEQTHPVGEKKPNQFGLYDMHGNVLEWCQDVYAADFFRQPQASQLDPVNEEVSDTRTPARVLKGGACIGPSKHCRSADRYKEDPDYRYKLFGMRPIVPINQH